MIGGVNRLSAVLRVMQLLLLPLVCLGFLCDAGVPLCAPLHHCVHDEAFAEQPAALPHEGCHAEHSGCQCEEEHCAAYFEIAMPTAPRLRPVGSAASPAVAHVPALPVLLTRAAGAARAPAHLCMARHRGCLYRGHLQPQRC